MCVCVFFNGTGTNYETGSRSNLRKITSKSVLIRHSPARHEIRSYTISAAENEGSK